MSMPLTTSSSSSTQGLFTEWTLDASPIRMAVLAAIGVSAQKTMGIMPPLVELVVDYLKVNKGQVFGEREWIVLCGAVAPAPPLPLDIENIWQNPCPFSPGKKIRETHMLVYIPTTVGYSLNSQRLTLNSLGVLARQYFPRTEAGYKYIWSAIAAELGDKPLAKSSWVLMTKDVLPGSRSLSYADQRARLFGLAGRMSATYAVPGALEAAVCILAQYISSQTRLFSDSPLTYTRCHEDVQGFQVVVGGFAPEGLRVRDSYDDRLAIGVAAVRKFSIMGDSAIRYPISFHSVSI